MKCCLIGEKLGHSYSKIIHEEFGFYSYDLVELKENQLGQFVKSGEYDAFNVTIPYKQAIMEYLDYVDPIARQIGAVNTVYRKNGKWCGTNTDYFGMLFMLKRGGITVNGKNVLILGSGGTAKTAISVCKSLSAKTVSVVSRTGEINYNNCYDLAETEVIINTTPVGMFPEINETPIDLSKFARIEGVVDVIYNPINTKLLQDAEKLNLPRVGGLSMLVSQAKFAMDVFTDKRNDDAIVGDILKRLTKSTSNLVLVGMPGSGKSMLGKALAKRLNKIYVDIDAEIERRAGITIPEIFEKEGEQGFRKLEKEVVADAGKRKCSVIATGGGVVLDADNYFPLKANGVICYVDRDIEKLATKGRPLSKGGDALNEIKKIRHEKYLNFADFTIKNNGVFGFCVDRIMEKFNESFSD